MECEPYPPSGQGHNSAQLHRESLWWTLPRCLPTAQLAGRLGLLCPSSSGERTRNASGISVGVQVGAASQQTCPPCVQGRNAEAAGHFGQVSRRRFL